MSIKPSLANLSRIEANMPFVSALGQFVRRTIAHVEMHHARAEVFVRNRAPALVRNPRLSAAILIVASMAAAYWWSFELVPGFHLNTLWAPYFLGPMGWVVAAGVSFYCYLRLPPIEYDSEGERPPAGAVLGIAALVGAFLVALQIVTGMLGAFGTSPLAHSPRWLLTNAFLAGSPLVAIEVSRAALLRAGGNRRLFMVLFLAAVAFALMQFSISQVTTGTAVERAEFWGASFLPAAAIGLLAGFFAIHGGPRASLLVTAPGVAFLYWSPFLPVAPWPTLALAGVAGPAMGLWVSAGLFTPEAVIGDEEVQKPSKLPSVAWVATSVIALLIFWFSFGFLGYQPSFVPTHSMEPTIQQGDVVLVGPVDVDSLEVGDIISFRVGGGQRVLHRINEIIIGESGQREFITKGDNNNVTDGAPIAAEQIEGIYIGRVPKLGWIPLKLNQFVDNLR